MDRVVALMLQLYPFYVYFLKKYFFWFLLWIVNNFISRLSNIYRVSVWEPQFNFASRPRFVAKRGVHSQPHNLLVLSSSPHCYVICLYRYKIAHHSAVRYCWYEIPEVQMGQMVQMVVTGGSLMMLLVQLIDQMRRSADRYTHSEHG